MHKVILILILCAGACRLAAQQDSVEKVFACKMTDYINSLSDTSVAVVQVLKPASFPGKILNKQLGVLYHCYQTGTRLDTASIGWGRCHLIKGDYYYFGIHLQKKQLPSAGELLYLKLKVPYVYDGQLLNIVKHAVGFSNVYGQDFFSSEAVFTNTKITEMNILDSMVSDIRFTGAAMLQQMPGQNRLITDGIYKGKNLFEAMQLVTRNELGLFLEYMTARPKNYAGNTWKISEIYATWMVEATPTVIHN